MLGVLGGEGRRVWRRARGLSCVGAVASGLGGIEGMCAGVWALWVRSGERDEEVERAVGGGGKWCRCRARPLARKEGVLSG